MAHKGFLEARESGRIRLFKSRRQGYADGEQERDFLYVKDAVEMALHLAANKSASGLFNSGSGRACTWNELARSVFAAMQMGCQIEYIEMPEQLRSRYQYSTRADIAKLRAFGFALPLTPLAGAVKDCVQSYLLPDRRLGDETPSAS
jgi:ADP-L-glycero-D-manno-heptose 6-epimerase